MWTQASISKHLRKERGRNLTRFVVTNHKESSRDLRVLTRTTSDKGTSQPGRVPTLFSYVVRYDDGAAPNPYWGTCTLVICKPAIRRRAQVGDWIIGLGAKSGPTKDDYSNRIVYVMKVTDKKTMREYDDYTRKSLRNKVPKKTSPSHRPVRDSEDWRLRLGDSIYDFSRKRTPQRRGVHTKENRKTDMSGKYALLSNEFVYFGDKAIPVPKRLHGILHRGQGHRSTLNAPYVTAFMKWWNRHREEFSANRIRGVPQWDFFADASGIGACAAAHRKEAEEDNKLDSAASG